MRKALLGTTIALSVLGGTVAAEASPIVNGFGLASPLDTVTFSEFVFAEGTQIDDEFITRGVTFSPALQYDSQGSPAFPGVDGHYLGNNFPCCDNPFTISFTSVHTAAAFGFATNPANTLFEALLLGVVVESFSQATNFNNAGTAFIGFTGITFDAIRITVGGDNQGIIDNIQIGEGAAAVPEPASMLLLGTGLVAAAARHRRARRA